MTNGNASIDAGSLMLPLTLSFASRYNLAYSARHPGKPARLKESVAWRRCSIQGGLACNLRSLYLWTAVGAVGLALWAGWWGLSWKRNTLVHVNQTWIMGWRFLGLDFLNNYQASRHWLAGGDAYRDTIDDPLSRAFCYPPLVLPTFAWVRLVFLAAGHAHFHVDFDVDYRRRRLGC